MRWDRLFADLEGEASAIEKDETDLLASDLTDDVWAETSWRHLVGGRVTLDVRGVGHLTGRAASVNDALIRLETDVTDVLVATRAVAEVVAAERRADPVSRVDAALGWPAALRRLRDADESVRMVRVDGTSVIGRIDAIGRDFVRIDTGGRLRVVVLDAVAVVTPEL